MLDDFLAWVFRRNKTKIKPSLRVDLIKPGIKASKGESLAKVAARRMKARRYAIARARINKMKEKIRRESQLAAADGKHIDKHLQDKSNQLAQEWDELTSQIAANPAADPADIEVVEAIKDLGTVGEMSAADYKKMMSADAKTQAKMAHLQAMKERGYIKKLQLACTTGDMAIQPGDTRLPRKKVWRMSTCLIITGIIAAIVHESFAIPDEEEALAAAQDYMKGSKNLCKQIVSEDGTPVLRWRKKTPIELERNCCLDEKNKCKAGEGAEEVKAAEVKRVESAQQKNYNRKFKKWKAASDECWATVETRKAHAKCMRSKGQTAYPPIEPSRLTPSDIKILDPNSQDDTDDKGEE